MCAGVFDFLVSIPYPETMAKMKVKAVFRCQQCGHESPRWHGRCPECGHWNSFKEETSIPTAHRRGPGIRHLGTKPISIGDLQSDVEHRTLTGISEFDRVLGGGVVYGSVTLVGGDPGIGKTTLLLQMLPRLSQDGSAVLYVSGMCLKFKSPQLGIVQKAVKNLRNGGHRRKATLRLLPKIKTKPDYEDEEEYMPVPAEDIDTKAIAQKQRQIKKVLGEANKETIGKVIEEALGIDPELDIEAKDIEALLMEDDL